jgi:type VI secretion system secreted protein Hcp
MSSDFHIKFDGVEGEATHQDHKGEIEILSWTWGLSNSAMSAGGGSGKGKANAQEMTISYIYNKASPVLAKKCAQGVHFKEVVLTSRKSGEGQKDFLKVTLKEVFITSVQHSAGSGGDIMESAQLSFGDVEYVYKPQDEKGGTKGDVKFGWNVKTTKIT